MQRLRVDLDSETYDRLAQLAADERRPIVWQAQVLIESGLGLRDRRSDSAPSDGDPALGQAPRTEVAVLNAA